MNKEDYFYPDKININGPINIVRLEGKVDNINKVIYIFMDFHLDVHSQTKCKNIFSKDIDQYFVDSFYNLNKYDKIYDFFFEIIPSEIIENYYKDNKKYNYIGNLFVFFKKIFSFNQDKNKVSMSSIFKNIRLHYLDIRDYFKSNIDYLYNLLYLLKNIENENITIEKYIDYFLIDLKFIKKKLIFITNNLKKEKIDIDKNIKIIKTIDNEFDFNNSIIYLIKKIKFDYQNNNVKKKLSKLIDNSYNEFIFLLDLIEKITDKLNNDKKYFYENNNINKFNNEIKNYPYFYIHDYQNKIIFRYKKYLNKLIIKSLDYFANFTDIFLLRRFLDKEYITNAITYTGAYHSINYIKILCNEFNFKLTHISNYNITNNINEINIAIKKKTTKELTEYFYPIILEQCSDLSNFPKNFL